MRVIRDCKDTHLAGVFEVGKSLTQNQVATCRFVGVVSKSVALLGSYPQTHKSLQTGERIGRLCM